VWRGRSDLNRFIYLNIAAIVRNRTGEGFRHFAIEAGLDGSAASSSAGGRRMGFMRFIGRIAPWKSLLTALVFVAAMFWIFDVAFNVIMPKGPLEAALGR
jgi:hypothetical protein